MKSSLSTLIADLMDGVGDTLTTGTADSNSTATYVIDAARTESDDDWNNARIRIDTDAASAAPEGEERRITDFVAASDRIVVFPAFTAAVTTGDTYSIREIFSYAQYLKAINHSIRMAGEWWPEVRITYPVAMAKVSGTCTTGTARSIEDTAQAYTADEHIGREVIIYEGTGKGQSRRVIDNDTDTLTVLEWETTPDTTSKFVIRKTGAAHFVVCSDQKDYPLPGGCKHVYAAWIETINTEESGTATSSTTTTLVDSGQAWTADEHIGRYVVIYDGTGAGQTRLITDNDTTSVTVPTWSIAPSTDSKYKIKTATEFVSDVREQVVGWTRILDADPDIEGGFFRLPAQPTEGSWIRLLYAADPLELASSSDVTEVPEEYIMFKAKAWLWEKKVGRGGFGDAQFLMRWNDQQADKYAATHRRRMPIGTIWRWEDVETVHSYDSPFRPT